MLSKYKDQDEEERAEAMKLMGVFYLFICSFVLNDFVFIENK